MKKLILGAALLSAFTGWAIAEDAPAGEDVCAVPGATVLTDATGDVDVEGLAPAALPVGLADLESLKVAYDDTGDAAKVVFTIKTGAIAQLPPQLFWYASFKSPNNTFYGVRMITGAPPAATFESYTLGASTGDVSDGRFVDVVKPADPASNYAADGTITIVVPALDIGIRNGGDSLKQFNSGSVLDAGAPGVGGFAFVLDGMPDDLSRRGEVTLQCGDAPKSLIEKMGGALNFALLLPLLGLAALRRRRA